MKAVFLLLGLLATAALFFGCVSSSQQAVVSSTMPTASIAPTQQPTAPVVSVSPTPSVDEENFSDVGLDESIAELEELD